MTLIQLLSIKISQETRPDMTQEQTAYVSGLADALEIVKKFEVNNLEVGKKYFVVLRGQGGSPNCIRKMELYRINRKDVYSYCFVDVNDPDKKLILHNKKSIEKRVFETAEEAEKLKDLAFI